MHVELSSEQTETMSSCNNEGLQSKKKKLEEAVIDLLMDSLEKVKQSKSSDERSAQLQFLNTLADTGIKIKTLMEGSIIMILEFESLPSLLYFGTLYNSGVFKTMLQAGFITHDNLVSNCLSSVTLEVRREDYNKCLKTFRQCKYHTFYVVPHLERGRSMSNFNFLYLSVNHPSVTTITSLVYSC